MRKVKGIWVAVALFGVVALGADIAQATIVSDTAIAYVLRSDATSFEGKVDLAKEVADESKKAFEGVTISWSPNTLDQVKAEIARQKELGLAAYVIQWGDTLSIIAEIIGTDVDTLAAANGIGDKDFILVGDLLINVLDAEINLAIAPVTSESVESPVETAKPIETKPVASRPEEKKPVEVKPVASKPAETVKQEETKPVEEANPIEEAPKEIKPVEEDKSEETPKLPVEEPTEEPIKETPVTPEQPEEPVKETPTTPEQPENPEESETPELPAGDKIVKERKWLEKFIEVVSTEGIFDGYDSEEVIEGEISVEEEVRNWEVETEGEWTTETTTETVIETRIELVPETRIELIPHTRIEQQEVEIIVGTDEEGNPISEIQYVNVEVVEMVEEEITEMVEVEVQEELEIEVVNDVYIPGPLQHYNVVLNNTRQTFDKIFIYDSTVKEGVEIVEQEGVDGVTSDQVLTVTQDGVVVDVQEGSLVASILRPQITRIGTQRQIAEKVVLNEHHIQEFAIIERETGDLYTDETEIAQAGINGITTHVKEQVKLADGSIESEVITQTNKLDTVDQIVLVGTKPIHTTSTAHEREELDVEVKEVFVNSEEAYTKVISEGTPKVLEHTYTINYEKGIQVSSVLAGTKVISEGTPKVIEVGLANVENRTRTEVEGINFNTITRESNKLAKGEKKVIQAGQKGETTIVFNETYVDGVLTSTSEVSRTVTKQAIDEIVEVGTGIETSKERSVDTPIKYTTKVVKDDTLYIGDTVIQQQGKDGYVRETFKDNYVDGKLVNSVSLGKTTTNPTEHIIREGTKQRPAELSEAVLAEVRLHFMDMVNEERASLGLNTLTTNDTLREGTQIRAEEIQEKFSHTRPDGTQYYTVFGLPEGFNPTYGENIAQNFTNIKHNESSEELARKMFQQFKDSPGHYRNMLNDGYVTHNFELTQVEDAPGSSYVLYYGAHIFELK